MEHVSCCTSRAWRVRLYAHDRASMEWVAAFDPEHAPTPTLTEEGVWCFEEPHRVASASDPLLEVHLQQRGHLARAWAWLEGAETRLHNTPPALSPSTVNAMGDMVRVATAEETLEIAMRWMLSWGHIGCTHPDEMCFWGPVTEATGYVVNDVPRWLDAGAPVPVDREMGDTQGVFWALVLSDGLGFSVAGAIEEALSQGRVFHPQRAGVYTEARPRDRQRALLAVSRHADHDARAELG